jgi:hypothetical protein
MVERERDNPPELTAYEGSLEALDRLPDTSELLEGEVMGAGRHVIQEGQARERLSRADRCPGGLDGPASD